MRTVTARLSLTASSCARWRLRANVCADSSRDSRSRVIFSFGAARAVIRPITSVANTTSTSVIPRRTRVRRGASIRERAEVFDMAGSGFEIASDPRREAREGPAQGGTKASDVEIGTAGGNCVLQDFPKGRLDATPEVVVLQLLVKSGKACWHRKMPGYRHNDSPLTQCVSIVYNTQSAFGSHEARSGALSIRR